MSTILNVKINLSKAPKDRFFKGDKGTYLDFSIAERKEADQYGNTHNVYLYKKGEDKIYIGNAKMMAFNETKTSNDDRAELNAARPTQEKTFDDLPF